jgi:hypothetical protein
MTGTLTMNRFAFLTVLAALCAAGFSSSARAADPVKIGDYQNWSAYKMIDSDGSKVCYMSGAPAKKEGKYKGRGDQVFALVTDRPAENTKDVFSYVAGYTYKPGSEVKLKIDGQSFSLFTQDETAWAPDAATDAKIAAALRKGSSMVVIGTTSRGNQSTDTFSLKGSSSAHDAMTKECGSK